MLSYKQILSLHHFKNLFRCINLNCKKTLYLRTADSGLKRLLGAWLCESGSVASVMVETRLGRIVQSLRRFIERIFADFLPDSS
jgi:hypothetical protein